MSAYEQLKTALESVIPSTWKFTAFEPTEELPDVTGLTMKIRSVSRLEAAPNGSYQVDWILTITSGITSREAADPALYDDLIVFLEALDAAPDLGWLAWLEATKTVGDDLERLAYDITLRIHTERQPADPA